MIAEWLATRSFRNLADAEAGLGEGLTVIHGANGAGKTNLLEALYFGLTGRSCRTRREREMIAFGESLARSEVSLEPATGEEAEPMRMLASVSTTEGRRRALDEAQAVRHEDADRGPAAVVGGVGVTAVDAAAPALRRRDRGQHPHRLRLLPPRARG